LRAFVGLEIVAPIRYIMTSRELISSFDFCSCVSMAVKSSKFGKFRHVSSVSAWAQTWIIYLL